MRPERTPFVAAHLRDVPPTSTDGRSIDAARFAHLRYALASVASAKDIGSSPLLLEFGVRDGRSISFMSSLDAAREWHGFDSFEGLPGSTTRSSKGNSANLTSALRIGWGRGRYSRHGQLPKVPSAVTLHKGWFNVTLPPFLDSASRPPALVAFAHMDADLYSSTWAVLSALASRCRLARGTVLAFDELFGSPVVEEQEWLALRQIARCFDLRFEFVSYLAHPKSAFGRASVRITQVGSQCHQWQTATPGGAPPPLLSLPARCRGADS